MKFIRDTYRKFIRGKQLSSFKYEKKGFKPIKVVPPNCPFCGNNTELLEKEIESKVGQINIPKEPLKKYFMELVCPNCNASSYSINRDKQKCYREVTSLWHEADRLIQTKNAFSKRQKIVGIAVLVILVTLAII